MDQCNGLNHNLNQLETPTKQEDRNEEKKQLKKRKSFVRD
jgi:hypothetical protein